MKTLKINEKYLSFFSTSNYEDATVSFPCEMQAWPWLGKVTFIEDSIGSYLNFDSFIGRQSIDFTTEGVEGYIKELLSPTNMQRIAAELAKRKQDYKQEVKQDITWYKPEYKLPDMSQATNTSEFLLVKVKKDNALSLELTDDAILSYAFAGNNSIMFKLDYSAIRETTLKTSDIEYWCYLPKPY